MPLLAFDTHKFITRLTEAGMAPEQAEVLADTYATILTEQVATKADIRLLQTDIARLDTRIDALDENGDQIESVDTRFTALEDRFQATIFRVVGGSTAIIVAVLVMIEFVLV